MKEELLDFYKQAKMNLINHGYNSEIHLVHEREFKHQTKKNFYWEYVYVVLNSGLSNKVAEKIYADFILKGPRAVNHLGKRAAIKRASLSFQEWFRKLQSMPTDEEKIEYLGKLSYLGPATKYHLARNLGIDCAKPDRHLNRLATQFGYKDDVQKMCKELSVATGDRVGTIDIVLWRNATIKSEKIPG